MFDLVVEPQVTSVGKSESGAGVFAQIIELKEGERLIARARWASSTQAAAGVAQVLELWVSPEARRAGHGGRLMDEVTAQARAYFKSRKSSLRRVWMAVEQKEQVVARSFLMKFTFHHVGTIRELLLDEDMLVYMRTLN